MKLLVISDIHGDMTTSDWVNSQSDYHNVDYVLVLGDITDFGPDDVVDRILGPIKKNVYALPGNCDPRSTLEHISAVAINMHGKTANLDGHHVAGLGGSNPTIFNTPFELEEDTIYNMLKPISKHGMILMVHAPPYGINDTIPSGAHVGSTSIKRIVDEFEPILVLSGHIHEDYGVKTEGETVYVNPGPAKEGMYAVVEVDNGAIYAELFSINNED